MDDAGLQSAVRNAMPRLVDFLSRTPEWVLVKAKELLPQADLSQVEEMADSKEKVSMVLDMFLMVADAPVFKEFVQSVCMECNLPMDMEIVFMSMSGEGHIAHGPEESVEAAAESSSASRLERRRPWSSSFTYNNCKESKQQRLDSAERYRQLIIASMLQRYGMNRSAEAQPLALRDVFVNLVIYQSKAHRGKGKVDKAKEEPIALHHEDDHTNTVMKLSDLFEGVHTGATKVILLLGKPGMGKTRLMHKICQQWAEGTLQKFQWIFLFEFRQLNLINRKLTLQELLFDVFIQPEGCPDDVFDHLLENAQHTLVIFDGLDESVGNVQFPVSPNPSYSYCLNPFSVSELFGSLCHGNFLHGCTVLVTTRPKMLPEALWKTITLLVEIWGFNHEKVEEYAGSFFHQHSLKEQALTRLKSNDKLLSLCYIPALCNIVCICLEDLLLQKADSIRLLQTMTQVYIQMLLIFVGKHQRLSAGCKEANLSQHRVTVVGLCELAFRGLEERRMLIYANEVSQHVKDFACQYGLLLAFEVKTISGHLKAGYTFAHFSLQEFFAALFLLTSNTVDSSSLKEKFFLRYKWILKKETRTAVTENCHIFLSGLSSQECRPFLSSLSGQNETWIQERQAIITQMLKKLAAGTLTGPRIIELCHCVHETQDLELAQHVGKQLNFTFQFRNFRLMPLDMMTLAYVINSSHNLVSLDFVGCPMELDYLAVFTSCENIQNLSFRGRRYGDEFAGVLSKSLPKIKCLTTFQLTGGNITLSGLEDLIQAFPNCHKLEDINLQNNKMKGQDMAKITEIFSTTEKLKKLDLSHNEISLTAVLTFARAAVTCPKVIKLHIRTNILTIYFTGESKEDLRLQHLETKKKETALNSRSFILRLQDCQLSSQQAKEVAGILGSCSHFSEIDLSGNMLGDEGCRYLLQMLPQVCISGQLNLSNNQLSLKSTFCLLNSMSRRPNIVKLEASLRRQTAILTLVGNGGSDAVYSRGSAFQGDHLSSHERQLLMTSRTICLTENTFHGDDLKNLCSVLRRCNTVSVLDLSDNSLGDPGVLKVAEILPDLKALRSLKQQEETLIITSGEMILFLVIRGVCVFLSARLNNNHISLRGIFSLVQNFSSLGQMISMDLGLGSPQSVHLTFDDSMRLARDHEGEKLRHPHLSMQGHCLNLRDCLMGPEDVDQLFRILITSSELAEINLYGNSLNDQSVEQLLKFLPSLKHLKFLSIQRNKFSANCVRLLANSFHLCKRIYGVEVRSNENAFLHFVESQESQEVFCRLTDCGIGPDDNKTLCLVLEKCDRLVELDLSGNQLGNEGLRYLLEHLPKIQVSCLLKISHNGISQDGVLHLIHVLGTCQNIAEVHASLCSEETLLITLVKQDQLQKILSLKQCCFQAVHLAQLSTWLGKCNALSSFMSTNNSMMLRDAEVLCRALRRPTGMQRISIEEPWVKDGSIILLLKLAAEVQGKIREITIRRDEALFVVDQEFPSQLESVVSRLHQCELEAEGIHFLQKLIEKCSQLQALNWSQVQLTDAEAETISDALLHFPALKKLELTSCEIPPLGTQRLASALHQCHALEDIDFSKSKLGVDGAVTIMDALQGTLHLKSINLGFLNLDSVDFLKLTSRLSAMPLLRRLILNNNSLSNEACLHLAKMLKNATHMEEINLSHNKIDDAGVKEIVTAVPEMQNIKQINLSCNSISSAGGQCLVEALVGSRCLEDLRLSGNRIRNETLAKLPSVLPFMLHLKVLHLSSCDIDSEGIADLVKGLCKCPQIEEISLSENSIEDKGVKVLAKWLPQSSHLRKIELKLCKVHDVAANLLARGISCCPLLEDIDLSWNSLGDDSAQELAKILPQMERLRVLDLDNNCITALGATLLAEALARCHGNQFIRLWHNQIPKEVEEDLQKQEPRMHFSFF
ncbi:protein NLRC5 [Tiliqua scincoides]|uniref:protein NLRC5 n=1 Tax=Tiliqua scincoides TaxID=71010 RepID=UPI003461F50C